MKDLTASIKGEVGKSIRDYAQNFNDLSGTIQDTQGKIDALNKLKYLTPAQKTELDGLKTKLGEGKKSLDDLRAAFELNAKQMVFNMLQAKLASDGLTGDEVDNLTTIAQSWGLIDDATANTEKAINSLDLSKGKVELSDINSILQSITDKPHEQNFKIWTNYTETKTTIYKSSGTPGGGYVDPGTGSGYGGQHAAGGSWIIPDSFGFEGFNLGQLGTASGGEEVKITPKDKVGGSSGGGGGNIFQIYWNGDYKSLAAEMDRRAELERLVHG